MQTILGSGGAIGNEKESMYDPDYLFVSDKFINHFDLQPTPYLEGIQEIIKSDYRK